MVLYHVISYDAEGMEYFFPNLPASMAIAISDLLDDLGLDVELKKVDYN